jgi:hypothetical protein
MFAFPCLIGHVLLCCCAFPELQPSQNFADKTIDDTPHRKLPVIVLRNQHCLSIGQSRALPPSYDAVDLNWLLGLFENWSFAATIPLQ